MNTQDMMDKARAIRLINTRGAQDVAASGKANEVIQVRGYFEAWAVGMQYAVGATVDWGGQPVTCITAHDTGVQPDWTPDSAPALWKLWHATAPEYALRFAWRHALDNYKAGEYALWGDEEHPDAVYLCVAESTNFTPGDYPAAWEVWAPDAETPVQEGSTDEPKVDVDEDGPEPTSYQLWDDIPENTLLEAGREFYCDGYVYRVTRQIYKQEHNRPPALVGDFYEVLP